MFNSNKFFNKLFKSSNQKELDRLKSTVNKINSLEDNIKKISDEKFPEKTLTFKENIKNGRNIEDVLPEAFALVREAAKRNLSERHYDVQLIGGIVLHQGKIAEMKTGEGKTLVSTLPVYLNALTNKGAHVVTVNDYLAQRDAEWMGKIYKFMGLDVGCITNSVEDSKRKENYNADITYGTNNEFGFDYLKDNMRYSKNEMVQRDHHFCIVDEVDSILIDEARTPLIISGSVKNETDQYQVSDKFIKILEKNDYDLDEKNKSAILSDKGIDRIENLSSSYGILKNNNFYDPENISLVHHINQALRANKLFFKDKDYIVRDNQVQIIDEFTGRVLPGRRFSDGLHQALEAKEKVEIQGENQTLASTTYQNYFRLYKKLSGMTGTAKTEAEEFLDIYNLQTISIPSNKEMIRKDSNDKIYRTEKEKNLAIINKIEECARNQQPILVGTTNIDKSEKISELLKKKKINHSVLNAKQHEQEAKIITNAGKLGAVTIATNMAGRGTDIQLGGNLKNIIEEKKNISKSNNANLNEIKAEHAREKEDVLKKGGLFVLGTERHESRRIDNQLRGRSGRQGDPGNSIFFISLEDDLMRIFGSESIDTMLKKFGFQPNDSIDHPWIDKAIERAQQKVEARNFDIRKTLLKFDDVMNDQRQVIFNQRKMILKSKEILSTVDSFLDEVCEEYSQEKNNLEKLNEIEGLKVKLKKFLGRSADEQEIDEIIKLDNKKFILSIKDKFKQKRDNRIKNVSQETNDDLEKRIFIETLDFSWRSHLQYLEQLRQVIGLRSYGQKDPLVEFKREAFELFEVLLKKVKLDVLTFLNNIEVTKENIKSEKKDTDEIENLKKFPIEKKQKISRNAPCICGSGKKFKHCCGAL